jgi:hypothetical protein
MTGLELPPEPSRASESHCGSAADKPSAAAQREPTVRRYVLDAVEDRLGDEDRATVLTATSDLVLARLWENDKDVACDALSAG